MNDELGFTKDFLSKELLPLAFFDEVATLAVAILKAVTARVITTSILFCVITQHSEFLF